MLSTQGWDPLLHRFLDLVDRVDKWKLQNHDGLETWRHPDGKFVVTGDSAHPMASRELSKIVSDVRSCPI